MKIIIKGEPEKLKEFFEVFQGAKDYKKFLLECPIVEIKEKQSLRQKIKEFDYKFYFQLISIVTIVLVIVRLLSYEIVQVIGGEFQWK